MLGVTDIEASVAFYTQKLGLALAARFEEFALLDAGGAMLTLNGGLARLRPPVPAPVEVVFSVDSVREAYDVLRARGVAFLNEPRIVDGVNEAVNFQDPDGHHLSLFGAP